MSIPNQVGRGGCKERSLVPRETETPPGCLGCAQSSPEQAGTGLRAAPRASTFPAPIESGRWGGERAEQGKPRAPHIGPCPPTFPLPRRVPCSLASESSGWRRAGGISSLTEGGPRQCRRGLSRGGAPAAHSLYGHREPLSASRAAPRRRHRRHPPRSLSGPRAPPP